jgi:hypothetical protein
MVSATFGTRLYKWLVEMSTIYINGNQQQNMKYIRQVCIPEKVPPKVRSVNLSDDVCDQ